MTLATRPVLQLRPYQVDTVAAIMNPPMGVTRQLVVAATGSGKTVMLSAMIDRMLPQGGRALVLAHREELLNQAKAEIEGFVPDLMVELEQAQNRATREHHLFASSRRHVVVGSVQTLRGQRLKAWAPDSFDLIIIDEAHHSSASSYVDIITHFGCYDENVLTPLIGVTATPNRSDGIGLKVVFQHIAAVYGIRELVELGFLCGIRAINVQSSVDISQVKINRGDFAAKELEKTIDDNERNALIVQAYKKWACGRPAVAFTAGVEHAHHLADWFRSGGISAESVWGDMDRDLRKSVFARFKSGKIQILTNCNLLTEGFNEPKTSCIILARPTKSSLILTQQVGRGTRLFPGKTDCLVIDVKDVTNGKTVVSVPSLAGLPPNFDTQGENVFTAAKKYEKLDVRLSAKAGSIADIDEMLRKIESGMSIAEIDLLAATAIDPYVEANSKFRWSAKTDSHYVVTPDRGVNRFEISGDTLGSWTIKRYQQGFPVERIAKVDELSQAFKMADFVIGKVAPSVKLIDNKAKWLKDPPSIPQLALLDKLGVQYPVEITKGQASALIGHALGNGSISQKKAARG